MVDSSQNLNSAVSPVRSKGIAVSRGVGIGNAVFLDELARQPRLRSLDSNQISEEVDRLRAAAAAARDSYSLLSNTTESSSDILDSHSLILESIADKAEAIVRSEKLNAELAIARISDSYINETTAATDRSVDIIDVAERLTAALDRTGKSVLPAIGSVLIAREIRPSSVMEYSAAKPAAIVTERGGWTSHSAIVARELGIPMVSGIRLAELSISTGDRIVVDGNRGDVSLATSLSGQTSRTVTDAEGNHNHTDVPPADRTVTTDGVDIGVYVNLDSIDQYLAAARTGVRGIGLYRSELLIRSGGPIPSESEQEAAYRTIADAAAGQPVSIRTFDIGCDELVQTSSSPESNPALGLRSIRLALADESIFRTQVRAIIRANSVGNIKIVLPFVSGVEELIRAKQILAAEMEGFISAGITVSTPSVGVMIEVPAAVMLADLFAHHADFLCLGTNDLVQYLLAVDRDNEKVSEWYQTLHPAVIRAIGQVTSAAAAANKPLTACGEMAGSPFYVPLLIGLGVRELSMMVSSVKPVRKLISGISYEDCRSIAAEVADLLTSSSIEAFLRDHYSREWKHLFPPGLLESPVL